MKERVLIIGFIGALFFVTGFWVYWQQSQRMNDMIIADDVAHLAEILNTIHRECTIIDFEHQKNHIDFLNVISFEGSEVGPMNLAHPERWRGAYLKDNPTIQEKYYQVVRTKKGYFVVPGEGVQLSNGLIIGKDILFDEEADIQVMTEDILQFKKRPLAVRIMDDSLNSSSQNHQEEIHKIRLRDM
jgi:hypothetical protein